VWRRQKSTIMAELHPERAGVELGHDRRLLPAPHALGG